MAVVSQYTRDCIADYLLASKIEDLENRRSKLKETIMEAMLEEVPWDIMAIFKKRPKVIDTVGSVKFKDEKGQYIDRLYFDGRVPDWRTEEETIPYSKTISYRFMGSFMGLRDEDKEIKTLRKKLICVLDTLRTTKRLKSEFPEAYEAYLKIAKSEEAKSENDPCTNIEGVRAELCSKK